MLDCDVAGGRGFEPLYRGPEPRVLPLDDPPERTTSLPSTPRGVNGGSLFALRRPEVGPEPEEEQGHEPEADDEIQTARVGPDGLPVRAQRHPDPRQTQRPQERAQERVEGEPRERDARRSGWE